MESVGPLHPWSCYRRCSAVRSQDIDFFVIAGDVACGMEFLHTRMQLMHRDLKSPNILMDMSGRAKLADFGLTCLEQPEGEKTAEIGTYRWMAPEVRWVPSCRPEYESTIAMYWPSQSTGRVWSLTT
jgi:serine/threonine protein kinase